MHEVGGKFSGRTGMLRVEGESFGPSTVETLAHLPYPSFKSNYCIWHLHQLQWKMMVALRGKAFNF